MSDLLDRTRRPAAGAIHPYSFPEVSAERLGNGMDLRVAPKVELPLVTALVCLDAGESGAPDSWPGLAVLAGDALEGGTEERSGRELAQALESIGASFGTATGWDSTTVAISCLADRLSEALPLLAEMVRRPAFHESEFDRYRSQRLATIAQRQMNPASLASDAFNRFLYSETSAYARPLGGTAEAMSEVGPDHARAFVTDRYGPGTGGLVLVGDVDPDEALAWTQSGFGDWEGHDAPSPDGRFEPRERRRAVHIVHRPGSVQSEIRIGHVGVTRDSPDYFRLRVLNLTLGGSFTSRLNLNLREKHGFTYGVRSRFLARRGPGPFLVSTAVETAVTGRAVEEIHREVRGLAGEGPTESEVSSAQSYLAGVFPLELETTGQIAAKIAELLVYDLDPDYYGEYRDRIRSVTPPETVEAAGRHLRPDELITVIVGDADAVADQLEGGGFGPVEVHE